VKVNNVKLKCFEGLLNSAGGASRKGAAGATSEGKRFPDWDHNWLSTWLRQDRLRVLPSLCDQPAASGSVTTARARGEYDNAVPAGSEALGQ
jgi:hypothetical protein